MLQRLGPAHICKIKRHYAAICKHRVRTSLTKGTEEVRALGLDAHNHVEHRANWCSTCVTTRFCPLSKALSDETSQDFARASLADAHVVSNGS
jgi:hypothetical protein